MESEERARGRDVVRLHLIQRLDEVGLKRQRGTTLEAHKKMGARLAEALAYMAEANVKTLAELIEENAIRANKFFWPSVIEIRRDAASLQRPPAEEKRIISSWFRSVEGPRARAGGYLAELYSDLNKTGLPPGSYQLQKIRERAAENKRRVEMISDKIRRGYATDEERTWLHGYRDRVRVCEQIVEAGEAGRLEDTNAQRR